MEPVRTDVQRFATAPGHPVAVPRRCAAARVRALGLAALCWPFAAPAATVDWNGYLSVASDYVYRGVSLLDTGANLQASVEARVDDTFVAGAWATNLDREWQYQRQVGDHVEVNVYAGADVGCGARCRARFIVTRYTYPGSDARDWSEATASVAFAERVGASLSWSPHGLGADSSTRTIEGWYVQPLSRGTSAEVDAGRMYVGPYDYWFARAGVSQRVDRWVFDLSRWWGDPAYRRAGLDDRSTRWVVSVSTAF